MIDETTTYCHCGQETSYPDFNHCLVCRCDEHAMGYCGSACDSHSAAERSERTSAMRTMDLPRTDGSDSYYRIDFLPTQREASVRRLLIRGLDA